MYLRPFNMAYDVSVRPKTHQSKQADRYEIRNVGPSFNTYGLMAMFNFMCAFKNNVFLFSVKY